MPTSEKHYFETTINIKPSALRLDKDFIGNEIPFNFRGHKLKMIFPNFDWENTDHFDNPAPTFKDTSVRLTWLGTIGRPNGAYGRTYISKDRQSHAFRCIKFVVRSRHSVESKNSAKLIRDLIDWKHQFISWLEVSTYTNLERDTWSIQNTDSIDAYYTYTTKPPQKIKAGPKDSLTFTVNTVPPFTIEQIKSTLKYVERGAVVPSHFQFLRNAVKHHDSGNYRESVMDSATALETALTTLIDQSLSNLTSTQKDIFMSKQNGIMNLFDVLKKLGHNLPPQNDFVVYIARPRNKAIHEGVSISSDQAKQAIDFAHDFLYSQMSF
jgi:hypothetical protein